MSAPRTKRQFAGAASDPAQRQITSFFGRSSNPNIDGDSSPASAASPASTPTLPAQVQSNLLSVGMRVRKSVPEGYKTGSAYGSFSLWADADARHNRTDGQPSLPRTSAAPAGLRELTPFCGIHKIGGLAVQPNAPPSYSFPAAAFQVMVDSAPSEDDDVPGLTSSQESAASTDSTSSSRLAPPPIYTAMAAVPSAATNRKRFFSDDEPGEAPGVHSEWRARDASWWDGEVSPRSLAPASWDNARVMAFPRRRSGKGAGRSAERPSAALAALGQENADMNMVVDAADFEDAPFLDFGWDERMDVE